MSAAENGPVIHGGEQTPPTRPQDTRDAWSASERHALVELLTQPDPDAWSIPTRTDAGKIADRILAAGWVRVQDDDETVDRVAKAMWSGPPEWEAGTVQALHYGEDWRAMARAAIAALRGSVSGGGNATK